MNDIAILTAAMALLERHPHLRRLLFSRLANAPLVSRLLPVLPRAFLGATAFECHEVDLERGRIGIGGVDEILWSSKFIELYHQSISERVGQQEKDRIMYEVGHQGGYWEVDEALRHGRWAPRALVRLVEQGDLLARLRADPKLARFFQLAFKMVTRIIINEGGWGQPEVDLVSSPVRITLDHSQEARWLSPAEQPVCYLSAGVMAGYTSRIMGQHLDAVEVQCQAMGHPRCVFEIDC